jgi:hypothetical protein
VGLSQSTGRKWEKLFFRASGGSGDLLIALISAQ